MQPSVSKKISSDDIKEPADRTDVVIDPVCGMTVNPESAAGSYEYKGENYYFCSAHCLKKFRDNPDQFLNKSQSPMTQPPVGIQPEFKTRRSYLLVYDCVRGPS